MEQNNSSETKKVFKVIFAWEDEKEEKWLEQMAASGWHLKSVAPYFYEFRRGAPETIIYRLDYKNTLSTDYAEYSAIFHDLGWELASMMGNWHYYRIKSQNQQTPEIYNSGRTKAEKYRRLLRGLLLGLLPFLPLLLTVFNPIRVINLPEQGAFTPIYAFGGFLFLVLVVLMGYAVIRIVFKIRMLESQSKE